MTTELFNDNYLWSKTVYLDMERKKLSQMYCFKVDEK